MYGLIGSILVLPENRAALMDILARGSKGLEGNLSYIIAEDAEDPSLVWVTESWTDAESHAASLSTPQVQLAMQEGRTLILGFGTRVETRPRLESDL